MHKHCSHSARATTNFPCYCLVLKWLKGPRKMEVVGIASGKEPEMIVFEHQASETE